MEVPQPLPKFSVFVPCPLFYTLATIPPPDYLMLLLGLLTYKSYAFATTYGISHLLRS